MVYTRLLAPRNNNTSSTVDAKKQSAKQPQKQNNTLKYFQVTSCGFLLMLLASFASSVALFREGDAQYKQDVVCDLRSLNRSVRWMALTTSSSPVQRIAFAKAQFLLKYPLATLPDNIVSCQRWLQQGHEKQSSLRARKRPAALYDDVVLRQDVLDEWIWPLLKTNNKRTTFAIAIARALTKTRNSSMSPENNDELVIVDIGSNINEGQLALPLARNGHTVYTWETTPSLCQNLSGHVDRDSLQSRVHIECAAVTDENRRETSRYHGPVEGGGSYVISKQDAQKKGKNSVVVRTGNIQEFPAFREETRPVHLFHSNSQGHEETVMLGSEALFADPKRKPRFVIVEISPNLLHAEGTKDPASVIDFLYRYGYVCSHLPYRHAIGLRERPLNKDEEGSSLVFGTVQTPSLGLQLSTTVANFTASMGPHHEWTSAETGQRLDPSLQGLSGWTDLLCFGD